MSFATALTFLLLQVGPNPGAGTIADLPEELRNRPSRSNELAPPEPTNPVSRWLSECLDLVENDPARAHSQAQIRRTESVGAQRVIANHCLGLAATGLGLWDDAEAAFTDARDETPSDELRTRARFGSMAGNAALAGGDANGAIGLLLQAEIDARAAQAGTLEAYAAIDRASALVAIGEQEQALSALDSALRLLPKDGEAWLLKATLLRRMERLDEAQVAIEAAGKHAPMNPMVGLEAGVIAILGQRDEAARASWQSVIDTAPGSPQAETARGYLAQLEPATPAQ